MSRPLRSAQPGDWNQAIVERIARDLKDQDGPLLPILLAIQERLGHIDARAIPVVAEILNLTRAEVHGVVSFYHDFRSEPAGRHIVQVCCAEACQAMGSDALVAELESLLGVRLGETTPDRQITLKPVYCLGNCALSPAVMIDGELHGRSSTPGIMALVGRRLQ